MWILELIFLIFLSAFFSASETSMMAVNRYRLRHLVRHANHRALRVLRLLERPDRLLGVVLIGNTFSNILASAVATIVAVKWFGELGVLIETVVLTLIILVFAETAPKTLAVLYSQRVSFWVSLPLTVLLKILYPFVWLVNGLANGILRLFGIQVKKRESDQLSVDELRSLVTEATSKTKLNYQEMLLRVLDLQQVTVDEAMIPKNEIYGVDLEWDWHRIAEKILHCPHSHLPVYSEHIDHVKGMLSLRRALILLSDEKANKQTLLNLSEEVYFVPNGALLHQQLLNFQREQKKIGLVVDEYGDIQGLLTLQDVLEEIVGEFDLGAADVERLITYQKDNSVVVDGSISVRDLNRLMGWMLPVSGPKTLSGLIIEYLEMIPKNQICVRIGGYPIEILSVSHNTIRQVRIAPALYKK